MQRKENHVVQLHADEEKLVDKTAFYLLSRASFRLARFISGTSLSLISDPKAAGH
jgi:hypothetical protein